MAKKEKGLELISCLCIDVHHGDRLDIFSQEVIIKLRPLEAADYEAVSVEQSQNVCPYFSPSRCAAGIKLKEFTETIS